MTTIVLKYIITTQGAVLFTEANTHSMVAEGILSNNQKVYSAGFVKIKLGKFDVEITPFGESVSMKLDSKPEKDKKVIEDLFSSVSYSKFDAMWVKELYEEKKGGKKK